MTEALNPQLIDISVPVSASTPRWPGSPAFQTNRWLDLDRGDVATDTIVSHSLHLGTHIDAPSHFLRDGASVERIPLETLIGPCAVLDLPDGGAVGPTELARAWPQLPPARVLLKTPNSAFWKSAGANFVADFSAVSAEGASWLVERGVRLVGIDYLSIQRFADPPDTHIILLTAGVVILEGLNLQDVAPGPYDLLCLPMRVHGVEAAPARALLRPA